jgi:hypothetical protein
MSDEQFSFLPKSCLGGDSIPKPHEMSQLLRAAWMILAFELSLNWMVPLIAVPKLKGKCD